jgi:hypothetical protein
MSVRVEAPPEADLLAAARALGGHGFEVCFRSLRDAERVLCFPCDVAGQVELDALTDCVRNNYLYARAMIGVEFARPAVHAVVV